MLLGFSTGVLHKQMNAKNALKVISKAGCLAVELGFVRKDRVDRGWLNELTGDDVKDFEYVSLHASGIDYGDNEETKEIFRQIDNLHAQRSLDLVVFHPNNV